MSDAPPPTVPEPTPTEPTPSPTPEPTPEPTPTSILDSGKSVDTPADAPLYDPEKLTLPEGFEKNETFSSFNEWAKDNGIKHDAAQKLIDLYANQAKTNAAAILKGFDEQNVKWQEEVKADKEVGGVNLQGVLQTISKVVDNPDLTDPKFREALAFTGAGNHPAVVRTLAKWAKALSEGSSVAGNPPGTSGQRPSLAESIYGPGGPKTGNPRMEI